MSPALPRIGILHAPLSAGTLQAIVRAAHGSCCPVLLFREPVALRHPELVMVGRKLLELHILPDGDLTEPVSGLGLAGLTTYSDNELEHVDRITADLGFPGAPAAESPWDKLRQRQRLGSHGLTRVAVHAVDSRADLPTAVDHVGLPSVLKPRRGVLGTRVAFLDTPDDVHYQQLTRHNWRGLILETRIPPGRHPADPERLADLVSVETVTTDRHHHIAIVDYPPLSVARRAGRDGADSINETGAIFPSLLPADVMASVQDYVSRCLTALGLRWRVTHTQLALTQDGPEVIEINGRTAGYNARLIRLVGGADLVAAAMTVAMGQVPDLLDEIPNAAAMLLLPTFPHRSSMVLSDVSKLALRSLPCVVAVEEIATHGDLREATGYRMATVMLRAASLTQVREAGEQVLCTIRQLFARDLD